MTPLRLHDQLSRHGLVRGLLACLIAVLAVAIVLHHSGWMGEMEHGGSASAPAQTVTVESQAGHADHAMPAPAPAQPAPGHAPDHAMTMAMCLAILASALLIPAVVWIRRTVAHRRLSTRRRARTVRRPPLTLLPTVWLPPPRGRPSPEALLCVVRR